MSESGDDSRARFVRAVRVAMGARAAGLWQVKTDRLSQLGFDADLTLSEEVARVFADATLSVPIDRTDLGIVAAAVSKVVRVSRAAELSSDAGSGYWLRAFGAVRSVAVPFCDDSGVVQGVLSVALATEIPSDEEVAASLRAAVAAAIDLF